MAEENIYEIDAKETPVTSYQDTLSYMDEDELEGFNSLPHIDIDKSNKTWGVVGKALMDQIVYSSIEAPGEILSFNGRLQEARQIPGVPAKYQDFTFGNTAKAKQFVGEKIRNFGIAIRNRIAGDELQEDASLGTKVKAGIGSGGASILNQIAARTAGTLVGGALGGVGGAILGYTTAGFAASYVPEKATMIRTLTDAGFSPEYINTTSELYAIPVASLDFASFSFLSSSFRPLVAKAVGKSLAAAVAEGVEGIVVEGVTEGLQQRIQTEFEVGTGARKRDWKEDMTDDIASMIVGGLMGGAVNTANQLNTRRKLITKIKNTTDFDYATVARLVDESFLEANDNVYSDLIERVGLHSEMQWIERAFNKIEGKELGPEPVDIETSVPNEYQEYEGLLGENPDQVIGDTTKEVETLQNQADEKMAAFFEDTSLSPEENTVRQAEVDNLLQELTRAEHKLKALQQLKNGLDGKVALTSYQNRTATRRQLRNYIKGFSAGKKATIGDIKEIQKSIRSLLKGSNLPQKAAMRMLRSTLTLRTPSQFNARIGAIISDINTLINADAVKDYQALGRRIIDSMATKKKNVDPNTQVFGEHLSRVFSGRVPLEFGSDIIPDTPEKTVRASVEQAVYDLANAESDKGAARRAVEVLEAYYTNRFDRYQKIKQARLDRITSITDTLEQQILKGKNFNELDEAFARVKKKSKKGGLFTPWSTSFKTILESLDKDSGAKAGQGPMAQAFNPDRPYMTKMTLQQEVRERIDDKLKEIYGPKANNIWLESRTQDFIDVPFQDGTVRNLSRAQAMSLFLMTKMSGISEDLKTQGYDENWVESFTNGENVRFTEQDYAFMDSMRETLDWFADQIAPIFERLTGRPFRRVDNYIMTSRFLAQSAEEGGFADNTSIIQAMQNGDFTKADPTAVGALKSKTGSKQVFKIPDLFEAMSFYAIDMVHFISYADYTTDIEQVFNNPRIAQIFNSKMPASYKPVIDEHLKNLVNGGFNRTADRRAMGVAFRLMGIYARNQVATPKNFIRQLTGVAGAMDIEGVNPLSLAQTIAMMPQYIASGELKRLTQTKALQNRFNGAFDMAVSFIKEFEQKGVPPNKVSHFLHNMFTAMPKYGDKVASILVGMTKYRYEMSKIKGEPTAQDIANAVKAGVLTVEETQQSMDYGKAPVAYNRSDWLSSLTVKFQRTQGQYLDRYIRLWKNKAAGRISNAEFIKGLMAWHVWVPLMDGLVTTAGLSTGELSLGMLTGPFAYHLIIGSAIRAMLAGLLDYLDDDDELVLPSYLKEAGSSTLVESFARDTNKLLNSVYAAFEEPDFESMWKVTKAAGDVAEIASPVPAGWLARGAEGIFDMLIEEDPMAKISGALLSIGVTENRANKYWQRD